jgi:RNA polymerase sigma-70 factor (ECF subfamily)
MTLPQPDGHALVALLDGPPKDQAALVARLAPVVKSQVAISLMRRRRQLDRKSLAQEADDLIQEVFIYLFRNHAQVLRAWDPERGLGLFGFVRMVSDRVVEAKLRSKRRNPWTESPTEDDTLQAMMPHEEGVARTIEERDLAQRVVGRLKEQLSPTGYHLFVRLLVQQDSVEQVCAEEKMTAEAVYAWRSRLKKAIVAIGQALVSENQNHAAIG